MALTLAVIKSGKTTGGMEKIIDVTFDDSYPTGGESLTARNCGLNVIEWVQANPVSGYDFEFDYTNKKLKVLQNQRTLTNAAVDLAEIAGGATVDVDVTVTGVATTDKIVGLIPPVALEHGIAIQGARVKAANTVTVRVSNLTAGAINPAAGSFSFVLQKDVAQEVVATTNLSTLKTRLLVKGY